MTTSLTPSAFRYFDNSSLYKNNRDFLPYLCYSTIEPNRIVWLQRIAASTGSREKNAQWYHVKFAWEPSSNAAWASDPVLRSHSVVLAPNTSPTIAKVYYLRGQWYVANIYDRGWMLPALARSKQ